MLYKLLRVTRGDLYIKVGMKKYHEMYADKGPIARFFIYILS